jgi:hypothetical protein
VAIIEQQRQVATKKYILSHLFHLFPFNMVSQISARLLAGTRDDSPLSERLLQGRLDIESQGSSSSISKASGKTSSSLRQKRTASGASKIASFDNEKGKEKVARSVSGYSADKEEASVLPPVMSIDLHGRHSNSATTTSNNKNSKDAMNYPKRQKINEMQFAAIMAKDDLGRAGMKFKTVTPDLEEAQFSGTDDAHLRIKLKGVRLIHSREVVAPLITSNVSEKSTIADYMALLRAVHDLYPAPSRMSIKSVDETGVTRDGSSSDSTSSVSDTESDCGSDNANNGQNNKLFFLPPRVEDSLDFVQVGKWKMAETAISPCNVISCASNAKTMTESIQLSKEPRCEPYFVRKTCFYSSCCSIVLPTHHCTLDS